MNLWLNGEGKSNLVRQDAYMLSLTFVLTLRIFLGTIVLVQIAQLYPDSARVIMMAS